MTQIQKRLMVIPRKMHFTQWEYPEFRKHFYRVGQTRDITKLRHADVLMVYSPKWMPRFADAMCPLKFGMLFPGFGFQPYKRPEQIKEMLLLIEKYTAVFVNEGPVWESLRGHPKVFLVPFSADHNRFKKTRSRMEFKKIIQIARNDEYKGRHISEAAMKMMPYQWILLPRKSKSIYKVIPWEQLIEIYQSADGFLSPNMIGPSPLYNIDAKYTQATMEAGLSGCIIFWHDCMNLGNSFETVFPISLDPKEISQKVQDIASSVDLDKHSALTAQEFYDKCNASSAVQAKIEIMKRFF